jgi:hypothetical protein
LGPELARGVHYAHIRIALIYNTVWVIARASRPNKQRALKPSI